MKKILLIEPNCKTKFPSLMLMKLSTFHKEYCSDYVKFIKGIEKKTPLFKEWDRIYITTLFTFDYNIVVEAINYYKHFVTNPKKIFIIGVLPNLMPEDIFKDTGIHPFIGEISSPSSIGYPEFSKVNINNLILDYDILSEKDYSSEVLNSYFLSTNKKYSEICESCPIKFLEPTFYSPKDLKNIILEIANKFGPKKNIILMDNSILNSKSLKKNLEFFKSLGFISNKKTFETPINFKWIIKRIERLENLTALSYKKEIFEDIDKILFEIKRQKKALSSDNKLQKIFEFISKENNYWNRLKYLKFHKSYIESRLMLYKRKSKASRVIDFNQGIDPKFLTEEKMRLLSEISIKPYRIFFDDINLKEIYIKTIKLANKYGVKYFSNYILYNFNDRPEDFWDRVYINIQLAEELDIIDLFSFPIKYFPFNLKNRKFTGKHWTKTQISNLQAILHAQKGIIPKNKEYFFSAFGKTKEEFLKFLLYPRDFLMFREFFKSIGYTQIWENFYQNLSEVNRIKLYEHFENKYFEIDSAEKIFKDGLFLLNIKKEKLDFIKSFLDSNNLKYTYETIFQLLYLIFINKIKSKVKITNFLKLYFLHR